MTKLAVPTIEDVRTYDLNPEILRYLESYRTDAGLPPDQVRVLDWGCGIGEAVACLLDRGYDAMGADISASHVEYGNEYFRGIGDPHWERRLRVIDSMSRLQGAAANNFDFVFSQTVLEHVEHLDDVAVELARLMKPGGVALHCFPARRHVVEQHLQMPCVHWLPKNVWRKWAIRFWVAVGREPGWDIEGNDAKVERYYEYANTATFYRTTDHIQRVFEQAGFDVEFVSIDHPKLTEHPLLGRAVDLPALRAMLNWAVLNFSIVELKLTKPR